MERIPYNQEILKWAREHSNLDIEDVAKKFNKPTSVIISWEDGRNSPTYTQLERLAYDIYKRPLAVFFFSEPPKDTSGQELFRTLPEYEFSRMSSRFTYLIRKAQARQENLKELLEGVNTAKQKLTNIFIIDKKDTIEETARKLRKYIGVSLELQQSWKNNEKALKFWRLKLEEHGIYVFKDAFKDDNFSGFCIYDEIFPIIYVNNSEPKTRQIFTLFHELVHILFKTGGIDTRLDDYIDYLNDEAKIIEVYCNKFAAEFLVPTNDFEMKIIGKNLDDNTYSEFATLYSVSREVILRKLHNMGKVDKLYYDKKRKEWIEQAKKAKEKKKKKTNGNHYNNIKTYLGKTYIDLVLKRLHQSKISKKEAADYLDIKVMQVQKLEAGYLKG